MLGGPQSRSGSGSEEKKISSLPPPGIETQSSSPYPGSHRHILKLILNQLTEERILPVVENTVLMEVCEPKRDDEIVVVRARNFMYCTDHHVLKGQ
jgi:hypothetical protein